MLDWLDHLTPHKEAPTPPLESKPLSQADPPPAPAAGLVAHVRRMAEFYRYTPDELAYAIQQAKHDPEAWRGIVAASMTSWAWTLAGNEKHPWIASE